MRAKSLADLIGVRVTRKRGEPKAAGGVVTRAEFSYAWVLWDNKRSERRIKWKFLRLEGVTV